jgi:FkbM family methyltransferase
MQKLLKDEKTGLYYRPDTYDLSVIKEQSSYARLFEMVKGKVVLDIGGNIGSFAYNALQHGAKEVVSFEPDPDNIEVYHKQHLKGAYLHKFAVASKDGKATFYVNNEGTNKGLHSLVKIRGREEIEVKTIAFSKVLEKIKPEIIKIDIEGGEYDLDFTLIPDTVKGIAIELHLQHGLRTKGEHLLKWLKKNFTMLNNAHITDLNWTTTFIGKR